MLYIHGVIGNKRPKSTFNKNEVRIIIQYFNECLWQLLCQPGTCVCVGVREYVCM